MKEQKNETTVAQPLLQDLFDVPKTTQGYWGSIAIALGKRSNKNAFVQGAWLDLEHGLLNQFTHQLSNWTLATAQAQWEAARADFLNIESQLIERLEGMDFHKPYEKIQDIIHDTDYIDEDIQSLRDQLFFSGIALQKAFIETALPEIFQNFQAYIKMINGNKVSDPALLQHLWVSGFLLTPVISTTFASAGRMFQQVPPESFGWLCIDEAGQAQPQDAVGCLMRAKKAIIVGDPQQLEPFVQMPNRLIEQIARLFSVEPSQWLSPFASVQTLADRVNPMGTEIAMANHRLSIGAPLLLHRRCREPMFSIMNDLAYNNLMLLDQSLSCLLYTSPSPRD